MMKAKIENLEIAYKSVRDLNEKAQSLLLKTRNDREKCEEKFRELRRREEALKKFLGRESETEQGGFLYQRLIKPTRNI